MCNFFSAVWDGRKNLYYFSGEQRKAGVTMPDGTKPNYDSHASICGFYHLKEDDVEKLEYNPYTDKLEFDNEKCTQYAPEVRALLDEVEWEPLAGDVQGCRAFIAELKKIHWFQPDGTLTDSECVRVFETRSAAWDAACNIARNTMWCAAWSAERNVIWNAARNVAWDAARNVAWDVAHDAAWDTVKFAAKSIARIVAQDAAESAALYARVRYVCHGLSLEPKHVKRINQRMEVWRHGYGLLCGINGILYCYKTLG